VFRRRLAARLEGAKRAIDGTTVTVARRLLDELVKATPVDTGRARSNWLVGRNGPVRAEQPVIDREGAVARAEGEAVLATVRPRDDVWLSNNVPYITLLNAGSSRQAPPRYVQETAKAVARETLSRIRVFPRGFGGRG